MRVRMVCSMAPSFAGSFLDAAAAAAAAGEGTAFFPFLAMFSTCTLTFCSAMVSPVLSRSFIDTYVQRWRWTHSASWGLSLYPWGTSQFPLACWYSLSSSRRRFQASSNPPSRLVDHLNPASSRRRIRSAFMGHLGSRLAAASSPSCSSLAFLQKSLYCSRMLLHHLPRVGLALYRMLTLQWPFCALNSLSCSRRSVRVFDLYMHVQYRYVIGMHVGRIDGVRQAENEMKCAHLVQMCISFVDSFEYPIHIP
mmetsp:Transcript_10727/g.30172  ORF Transcript_10727/g.30172 Transcript_10727/m.30172 type:complete len:252 (+) Transcript_10727:962-1717(+)